MVSMSDITEALKNVSKTNTKNAISEALKNNFEKEKLYQTPVNFTDAINSNICKSSALIVDDTKDRTPSTTSSSKKSSSNPTIKTVPVPTKKPQASYKFQSARTDKRVSLNCAPLTKNTNTTEYIKRLRYVLGEGKKTLKTGQTVWGFLNATLSKSCGLLSLIPHK